MKSIIDLGSELLVDRSQVRSPQLQLLLAAIGQPLTAGSPWIAVSKKVAALFPIPLQVLGGQNRRPRSLAVC